MISASLEVLAVRSAIDEISPSRIAAASMFFPELNALAVFFRRGVNALNACEDSAAIAPDAAPLAIAPPSALSPAFAMLPLIMAPTAKPEFLTSLSNKKLVVNQLSVEYHAAFFSALV